MVGYITKTVLKSGATKYILSVYVGQVNGREKRKWYRFDTKRAAQQFAAKLTLERANGNAVPDGRITVHDYFDGWLRDRAPNLAATTAVRYRELFNLYIDSALGSMKLARLNPSVIQSFYVEHQKTGHPSGTTMLYVHRLLHVALRTAVRRGLLFRNPASAEYIDPPRKNDFEPVVWDFEQCRTFLGEARRSSPLYPLYLFCLTTGSREGEAFGLSWDSVNLDLGEVTIQRKLYRLYHEKKCDLLIEKPKTKNAIREIPLLPTVVAELRKVREEHRKNREVLGDAYSPLNLVFSQANGKPLHVRNVIIRDFLKVIERAKLPRIRFHDLRHATASYLIGLGVDINTVSRILGHSSSSFTLRQYVRDVGKASADALKRDAMSGLEGQLFPSNKEG